MNQTLNLLRIMKIKGNVQNDVNDMYLPTYRFNTLSQITMTLITQGRT